jgi:DNA gyrase subunit A
MARSKSPAGNVDLDAFDQAGAEVHVTDIAQEIGASFQEYALSVIHSRALPDVRDGLKPVHRRILFGMSEAGLRPDHAYVKSARVVGDVMGRYHPHGDSAIYEALVRLAQPFSVNTPLIDGHGNFGSPDDGPAAMRYTECRLSQPAMWLVGELGEDTVDFRANYDGSLNEPDVLPAAFPNLLVNGSTGIAVGMATNMIPHNLTEVIAAARHLIKFPNARLDTLMEHVPGPDLPTGGLLIGMDAVRSAYETGRGAVRIRARAEIGTVEGGRGRAAIIVTELPYNIGAEKIIESIKDEIGKKRLQGIADVKDLTDRVNGIRLVVECKTGVNASVLLESLYRYTPMETTFGIANVALVDGQPKTLGLKELLTEFLAHRYDVVTRRTQFRLRKAQDRLHIVDGLLTALDNIDEVVKIIRGSKNTSEAREKLINRFNLSDVQAGHILDMPLRRLVALEVESLRAEKQDLLTAIAGFEEILGSDDALKKVVSDELAALAKAYPTERRTTLVDGDLKEVLAAAAPAGPLEVEDEPCQVILSATGMLARTAAASEDSSTGRKRNSRGRHDAIIAVADTSTRGQFLAVTSNGRAFKTNVLDVPALPEASGIVTVANGVPARELLPLSGRERIVAVAPLSDDAIASSPGLALGTRSGVVKVTAGSDWPVRSDEFDVIGLKDGDEVVAAAWLTTGDEEFVFVTSDAQLLRFPASLVRPQGRSGGGVAGITLRGDAHVIAFSAVHPKDKPVVVTYTGKTGKTAPLADYPGKGRATGGVRCHSFLKGEDRLTVAGVTDAPVGCTAGGNPVDLPPSHGKRDGSGYPMTESGLGLIGYSIERE